MSRVGPKARSGSEEQSLVYALFEKTFQPTLVQPVGYIEEQKGAAARRFDPKPCCGCPTQFPVTLDGRNQPIIGGTLEGADAGQLGGGRRR